MPPKRTASSASKRKPSPSPADDSDEPAAPSSAPAKKARPADPVPAAGGAQPTNKVLPTAIAFPAKAAGALRIATWNVSGLAASQKKGFKYYVEAEDPDILILTETKVNNEPADPALAARFPHRYWSIAEKKGYSGTAVLSKHAPLSASTALPGHPDPAAVKGRLVTLEFARFWLVATYVVNAGQDLKALGAKEEWHKHFEVYVRGLEATKPVIWAGDVNVAPTERDLTHAKRNWNKTAGYTESETRGFARILDPSSAGASLKEEEKATADAAVPAPDHTARMVDVWRHLHPNDQHYTYFSYRFNCRTKGLGWRLDMFILSERLVKNVKLCEIRSEIYGASDHCPVVLEIEDVL